MSLILTVRRLVKDRVTQLEGNNEYLVRQIQFLSQRLEDFKKQLSTDTEEVHELKTFLRNISEEVLAEPAVRPPTVKPPVVKPLNPVSAECGNVATPNPWLPNP